MCNRSRLREGDEEEESPSRSRPLAAFAAASGESEQRECEGSTSNARRSSRATRATRRGAKTSTLRPSYGMGMWRALVLLACLSIAANATVFTEGGAVLNGQEINDQKLLDAEIERELEFERNAAELMKYTQKVEKQDKQEQQQPAKQHQEQQQQKAPKQQGQREPIDYNQDAFDDKAYMEYITQELIRQRQQQEEYERQQQQQSYDDLYPFADLIEAEKQQQQQQQQVKSEKGQEKNEGKSKGSAVDEMKKAMTEPLTDEELEKFEEFLRRAESENYHEFASSNNKNQELNRESVESAMETATGEPKMKQKKGQNEFVSFVEPEQQPMKQTVSSQIVDKRRLSSSAEYSGNAPRYSSSSLLLLAVGTVMSVGIVGTVAGGAYYWKRRSDTPDDGEYAPYAGTGPGFKKPKGAQCDETLAYKAQLHQYQQAKQKIICGEDAPGIIESDGEDGADEENNFSVYECPGLAPTGDIEVCNPNFAAQP